MTRCTEAQTASKENACDALHELMVCMDKALCMDDDVVEACKKASSEEECSSKTCEVGMSPATIIAIATAAVAGLGVLVTIGMFIHHAHANRPGKRKKARRVSTSDYAEMGDDDDDDDDDDD